ncbi:MAG: hypothetical protein Q4F67_08175 [Propionibacteriaceae bacterium]|nr:hypothetical protein [Propionibacteriaceae bacterium]
MSDIFKEAILKTAAVGAIGGVAVTGCAGPREVIQRLGDGRPEVPAPANPSEVQGSEVSGLGTADAPANNDPGCPDLPGREQLMEAFKVEADFDFQGRNTRVVDPTYDRPDLWQAVKETQEKKYFTDLAEASKYKISVLHRSGEPGERQEFFYEVDKQLGGFVDTYRVELSDTPTNGGHLMVYTVHGPNSHNGYVDRLTTGFFKPGVKSMVNDRGLDPTTFGDALWDSELCFAEVAGGGATKPGSAVRYEFGFKDKNGTGRNYFEEGGYRSQRIVSVDANGNYTFANPVK